MLQNRPLVAVLLVLGLLSGMALTLAARTKIKPGMNFFSKQQEVQLGREASAQVEKEVTLVRDSALTSYVNQLGQRLARYSPEPEFPYTFKVVRDKKINAFALPGGPVYVNTGTIAAAENEAQLAGVLGHEIGHVALRHGTNNASKAMLAQLPLAALGGIIGQGSIGGQLAQLGIGFGLNSVMLKYSRDAERQADIVGAQMLYDAGYNAEEMVRFFENMQKGERGSSVEWLSSHPNPGNRAELVRREISELGPQKSLTNDGPGFAQARSLAGGINRQPAADRPGGYGHDASGEHQHPGLPSRNFRVFDGGSFRISYPDNWQVYGEEGSAATIAPREGIVRTRDSAGIAYGAMISIFEPEPGEDGRISLSEATAQLIEQLRQSNSGLRTLSGRQRFQVDGRQALSTMMMGRSPVRGENETDWLVTVLRSDGTLWYVVFVAPERDFSTFRPAFEQMLDSVRLR